MEGTKNIKSSGVYIPIKLDAIVPFLKKSGKVTLKIFLLQKGAMASLILLQD
jgi:hypothetical protein